MPIVPLSSPVASLCPLALKLSESTGLPVWPDSVVAFPVERSRRVTLPSVCPKTASGARGASAAGAPSLIVLTVFSVRESRRIEVAASVLATSRYRPSGV